MPDLILTKTDAKLLEQSLLRYVDDTGVRLALLISRDGFLLAQCGATQQYDITSLCALAVGAFASSEALARLTGEESFNAIFHQGLRSSAYVALVGETHLLLSVFDYNASAALVRLQTRVATEAIQAILRRAAQS